MSSVSSASLDARPGWGRGARGLPAERAPAWRAGVIGAVVVHIILVVFFWLMPAPVIDPVSVGVEAGREFTIELAEVLTVAPLAPPVPPAPERFVEVNPAAPENPPDAARLFGAQNQQVAQPEPAVQDHGDTPAVEGEGGETATALVSGVSREPEAPSVADTLARAFASEPAEPSPAEEQAAEEARRGEALARAANALGGGEQLLGEAENSVGTTVTRLPEVPGATTEAEPVAGRVEGTAPRGGYFAGQPAVDRARPRERPRLSSETINARSTPTIKNEFGTANIGVLAYSAAWSAHGEYLQRLIDAVQTQWERLILRSSFYPVSGSLVRVVFRLDSAGEVAEIVGVDGTGGELARRLCVSAIAERAPYGAWTDDMLAVLGRDTELTFTFHYQ